MKNEWVAAFLNLVPGAGYLYLGTRTPFAVILLSLWPATLFVGSTDTAISQSSDSSMSWGVAVILLIPAIAFMTDAYYSALEYNARPGKKR